MLAMTATSRRSSQGAAKPADALVCKVTGPGPQDEARARRCVLIFP
jgi:hypothetical protein